ncbi:MAG: cyclodeaminase/cyclohydrolase family protein [Planctomycetota bacterium]
MYSKISLEKYLEMIAAPTATPGGGSVSAYAGALGAALGHMACGIALKKVLPHSHNSDTLKGARKIFHRNHSALLKLAEADSAAYDKVCRAYKLPHHFLKRRHEINKALKSASDVPYQTMLLSLENLDEIGNVRKLLPVQILSDINVAALLSKAAYNGARLNVIVNVESLADKKISRKIEKDVEKVEQKFAETILWLDDWM